MTSLPKHGAKLTYEDLLAIPEDDLRHEIIDGRHYVSASPRLRHQRILLELASRLKQSIDDAGRGWVYLSPTDVELTPHDIVVPDLIAVRRENESILTETRVIGAPDLLIEILSPSTRARDLGLKRERYRMNGVREYWIVDPDAHSITRWDFAGAAGTPETFTTGSCESVAFPGVFVCPAEVL